MASSAKASGGMRLADLGIPRAAQCGAFTAAAALPAAVSLLLGGTPLLATGAAVAGLTSLAGCAAWLHRRLQAQFAAPMEAIARAVEELRATGQSRRLEERGAALLQPLLRRFNQALLAVEQRDQRSRAEQMSVEAAFDRVHAVLQSLRECVLVVDPRGRLVLQNRSARQLLGENAPPEGTELLPHLDGELGAAVRSGIERLEADAATEIRATDVRHGDRIYDLGIIQVQSNRPDQDFGKVIVLADVTRNHEIHRLKDELLSSISHELRTPLTNMCSSSEILTSLTAADEATWREFATMLHTESHRLKAIVDDVLEFSQLETKGIQWQIERADVNRLAAAAVQMAAAKAAGKRIDLSLRHEGPAMASIDSGRLTEVLCRLLDNAIKFTPEGGKVHITTALHAGMVEVAVADSGIGVPPEHRQRVFERFAQVGDLMTGKPPGAGLGLSIAQRILDAFGGQIWCEDSPLGGAQFRFVLPQVAAAATQA